MNQIFNKEIFPVIDVRKNRLFPNPARDRKSNIGQQENKYRRVLMFAINNIKLPNLICLLGSLLLSSYSMAQQWPIVYGDNFHATISNIEETYDHGFLLSAYTYTSSGWPLYDWIIKIDINGSVLWEKRFGDGIYSNGVTNSKITQDNGIILAASTSKYSGDYDPTFIKLNVCGEMEWCRVFQSPDQNYGTGILQQTDASYIGMLQYYGEGQN
jgi:hypothetical protein